MTHFATAEERDHASAASSSSASTGWVEPLRDRHRG